MTDDTRKHKICESVPISKVDIEFLMRVEKYQEKKFTHIGMFDIALLRELVERVEESDICGEVELLATIGNEMYDGTTSGLLVVKYNGSEYMALAGMTDHD